MESKNQSGFFMPAEWHRHKRTWMAWPANKEVWKDHLEAAQETYLEIAQAIATFEPVTMLVQPELVTDVSIRLAQGISVLPMELDDAWVRDTGPTFLISDDQKLGGVDWRFNGWGGIAPHHAKDAQLALRMIDREGAAAFSTRLINEGGAVHTDGEGTCLVCQGSLLDPKRNPNWTREEVDEELGRLLGVQKVIWLPKCLEDDETAGHVDNLACFSAPGHVLTLDPKNASNAAERTALEANMDILRRSVDAKGRTFEIKTLPLPKPKSRHNGAKLTQSYINFYLCNGGLIAPVFEDASDSQAVKTLQAAFPDREIVTVNALSVLEGGGGIHCITQQQPELEEKPAG